MIRLSKVGESRSESQGKNLRVGIGLRRQDPVKLHEVIHVNPRKVMIWNRERGHVNCRRWLLVRGQSIFSRMKEVFSSCASNAGCNCSKICRDKIKLSFVHLHGTGPGLLAPTLR